jgi:hypothetical protein
VDTGNDYQLLQDVDGSPQGGVVGRSGSVHHRVLKMMSMMGPLGSTVNGSGSIRHRVLKTMSMAGPWGRYRRVRHRPPPRLKTTSMAGPLGGAAGGSDSGCH